MKSERFVLILNNTDMYIRIVLFFVFIGHGLVSLGFSPSQALHLKLVENFNWGMFSSNKILQIAGVFDIIIGFSFLFNLCYKIAYRFAFIYLLLVIVAVLNLYQLKTGSYLAIAEILRRISWILLLLFLHFKDKKDFRYNFIRFSSSSAFIAHGLASLGFFGFNQAHIEIASQIIPDNYVNDFIFYSGTSDLIIGILLLLGIYTRTVAAIGSLWIFFIVILSSIIALPDGIFRLGFLMVAFYNVIDDRTSRLNLYNFIKSK